MNNQFSENLKKIRKDHNLSQEQLADSLGVSRQAISKWESGIAYPEMDKIIALCDMFQLNIDDLLHKDVKEMKGEEESKKKINHYVDDFLAFVTDTVNLFGCMSFKSKVKCIVEQLFIALVLYLASCAVLSILERLSFNVLQILPDFVSSSINNTLQAALSIFLFVASIVIMVHLFKTRYLDYYTQLKGNQKEEAVEEKEEEEKNSSTKKDKENKKEEKVEFKKEEDKIIIRDPKHSEYHFINGLFKIIIFIIKFFALWFAVSVCFVLVGFFVAFVLCFLIYKTGWFFLGSLLTVLSCGTITAIILAVLLNFIFNRKSNKKVLIWGFIISVIAFGVGCGLISIGVLQFDLVEYDNSLNKTVTVEYDMIDSLSIYPFYDNEVVYVEEDIPNVKIDYSICKYCEVDSWTDHNGQLHSYVGCKEPMKLVRETLKLINDKKIIYFNEINEGIVVHASSENINRLKENWQRILDERVAEEEARNAYESRIEELEDENEGLNEKVQELNDQIADLEERIEDYKDED